MAGPLDHLDLPSLTDQGRCAKQKTDMPSRVEERIDKRAAKEANWRVVSRQVDKRDHYRCRACGATGNPDGVDVLDKLHRHHLAYRSHGGQDVASNLLLLCARCHDEVHVKRTLRIDAQGPHGADGGLDFWRQRNNEDFLLKHESACGVTERD